MSTEDEKKDKKDKKEKETKINPYDTLVISGGAVKGLILLGSLQYAADNSLLDNIENYIGTSAGSIISYLLVIGYTPIEIMVYICTHRLLERLHSMDLVAMLNGNGALSYMIIQESLEKMTLNKVNKFLTLKEVKEKFGKTLICTTYNKTRDTVEYIGPDNYPDLPCLIALRMSANVPLLFEKFKYLDHEYIDGGIVDNFPIMKGEEIGEKVLGFFLEYNKTTQESKDKKEGFLQYLYGLIRVPMEQAVKYKISLSTKKSTCIGVSSTSYDFFNFDIKPSAKLDMFSAGYQCAKKYFEKEESKGEKEES